MRFTINERAIKCTNEQLIGDNADYIASFSFDAEWDGKVKTARFTKGNMYVDVLLENDSCVIPVEVLKQGFVRVGAFASEITTTYCEVRIRESIKEKNGSPIAPSQDIYAQIIKMIEDMEQQEVPEEEIEKAVEGYLAKHPIEAGITEEECLQIMADFYSEHHSELKGDKGEQGIQGEKGADGETPVKGVDYFTESDKSELVQDVISALPKAEGGAY